MKANISANLRTVLRDREASRALTQILVDGKGGDVKVGGRRYTVVVGSEAVARARSR